MATRDVMAGDRCRQPFDTKPRPRAASGPALTGTTMNRPTTLIALAAATAAVVTMTTTASTFAAPAAPTRQGARVAHGQIVVHNDSHTSHVVPSPTGDPNVHLQLSLYQDFTGDFQGHGTAEFFATVHHDGEYPEGTITFTGREAEYGTIFGHSGAFYFKDTHGMITPNGKVTGDFTSDGGELGLAGIDARGTFFPTANPSDVGNLDHTTDYAFAVRFDR